MEALGLAVVIGVVAASWWLRRWTARRTAERLRVSRETVARLRMIEDSKP